MNIEQLKFEIERWYYTLDFIKQENVHLKNRLSKVIQNKVNKDFLEKAEDFQNNSINKDAIIGLLKHDMAIHQKNITKELNKNPQLANSIMKIHDKLREDVAKLEKEFNKLKTEFNETLDALTKGNDSLP